MMGMDRGSYPPFVATFLVAAVLPGEGWGKGLPW